MLTFTEQEVQALKNRVSELELQLKEAQATILALTSVKEDKVRASAAQQYVQPQFADEQENRIADEERFKQAILVAPYPLMIRRDDGKVLMVNVAWTEITGYTLEDIPTIAAWIRQAHGEGAPARQALIRNEGFSQADMKQWGELEVTTRSGERRMWDFSSVPLGVDSKGHRLAMTMAVDITERKHAEQALRESEARLGALVSASAQALYRMSPDWQEMRILQGGNFLEDTPEPNRNWLQKYIHPDDQPGVLEAIENAIRTGKVFELEHRVLRADGSIGWTASRAVPVWNTKNEIVEWFGAASDITERKRAQEALRESEERFRSLADSMPQLVWTARPDGAVDYYNQRYHEYWEMNRLGSAGWDWSSLLHPDDLQPTLDAWMRAIDLGDIYQIEHRVRMADGSYRWHLSRGIPVLDKHGRIKRWFGTATDIHEQKLAEGKLKSYAEQLERSNRELEQFAFLASHDLQEPLRKIQAFGDTLLERATSLSDQERMYLDRMRSAAGRMRDMVQGLLQLSRVNTQGKPFVQVDLSQVTLGVLGDLEEQTQQTGARIEVGHLPVLEGDSVQLRQMMQNLIGNALKYHAPSKSPRVKIFAAQLAGKVQISVEDNGIGFQQEDAERIFEPFQRLVNRSQYEGSGMGLAICRRIVERHRGEITALSKPGEGTTFIVTLPVHQPQNADNAIYIH